MRERKASIREHMKRRHAESWPILRGLSSADLDQPVYVEEAAAWTVKDVLGHLADAERGNLGQVQRLIAGEVTVPEDFDPERWNRSAVRKRAEVEAKQLLQDIEKAYQDALTFLEGLEDQTLDLRGRHAKGDTISAEAFFRRMADHRAQHAADIRESLQR